MRIELKEFIWVEEQVLSFSELAEQSGLPEPLLEELVAAGGISSLAADPERYGAAALTTARQARRLHEDFELDSGALLVVLGLIERMRELDARLTELQAKLPRRVL